MAQLTNKKEIRLKGKAAVFVDWANVHGWEENLKIKIDLKKLYEYLKSYKEVTEMSLYFGTDNHPKSKEFLKQTGNIGYRVITKPVKYIFIDRVGDKEIFKRKCDFDMEVCIDVHQKIQEKFESFVFLTGDGDYAALYKLLIGLKKQVIVIYAHGHLGREIYEMKKGVYKKSINTLGSILKNKHKNAPPDQKDGGA